jgi:hypothetical protein
MKKTLNQVFGVMMVAALILTGCQSKPLGPMREVPVGQAYAEGKEIYFTHTEASDPAIAEMLTNMMNSPVFYVPSLSQVPDESLANVYVFKNGLKGMGPLGFQPDVFDNAPGTPGYSPLRRLNVVTWVDPDQAIELKSAAAVLALEQSGDVTIEQPGVVINMPFIVWDGGNR